MSIEKKIVVTSDNSQAESNFSKTASSLESMMGKVADSVDKIKSNFSNLFQSISRQDSSVKTIFNDMVQGAEKVAKTREERVKHIDKELQALARVNQEHKKAQENEAQENLKKDLSGTDPEAEKQVKSEYDAQMARIKKEAEDSKEQILALHREKKKYQDGEYTQDSSQQLSGSSESEQSGQGGVSGERKKESARNVDQNEKLEDTQVAFQELVKESEQYSNSAKERLEYIEKELKLLDRINKEERLRNEIESRETLREDLDDAGYSEKKKKEAKEDHTERMSEISDNAKKAQYQHMAFERLKQEYSDKVSDEEEPEEPVRQRSDRNFVRKTSGIGKTVGAAALGAAGFGAILSISGFIGNLVDQANQLGKAKARMGAAGFQTGSVEGLKEAEEIEYSKNIARSIGRGNVSQEVTKQGILERGTGMDLGSTTRFNTVMRSDKDQRTLTDATVEMLNIMKSTGLYNINKDDFTMLNELMSRSNELNSIQSNQADLIDSSRTNKLLAAFGSLGGSFKDQRQTGTISGVNQDIRGGGNDFTNAFMMRSIMKNDPDSSLWDVLKTKDEGVFKEGQFQDIVKDVFASFKGDDVKFNLKKLFPSLNYSQVESLYKNFNENPDKFENIESTDQLSDVLDLETIQKRGGVGDLESWKADFDDSMSKMGDAAVEKISSYIDAFKSGGFDKLTKKFSEDIHMAIASAFDYGVKKFKTEISPSFKSNVNKVSESFENINTKEGQELLEQVDNMEGLGPEIDLMTDAYKMYGWFTGNGRKLSGDTLESQGNRASTLIDPGANPIMKAMAGIHQIANIFSDTEPSGERLKSSESKADETNKLLREQNEIMRKKNNKDTDSVPIMLQDSSGGKQQSSLNILTNSNLESVN